MQAHAFRAVIGDRANISGLQLIETHTVDASLAHLRLSERHFHAEDVRRIEQPLYMLVETEDRGAARGVVGTNAFERAGRVMQ